MVLFLTSSFIPYQEAGSYAKMEPSDCYGFFDDLKEEWPGEASILCVPADPDNEEDTKIQMQRVVDAFEFANLPVKEVKILKKESGNELKKLISEADVLFFAGGHAPTQLAYMKTIGLKDALSGYDGVIITLSAGSANSAYSVYLVPEFDGEATDPNYVKFSDGLDLTNIQMIPHMEYMKNMKLDGLDYINDIILPDSYGRRFYMITDGSYFKVKDGITRFSGVGEIIEDGEIKPLKQGIIVPLMGYFEQTVIKTLLADGYDMVVGVHKENGTCEVYYLSDRIRKFFESSRLKFNDVLMKLAEGVVEEERESVLEQVTIPTILQELKEKGDYVRTIHVDTINGRRAKNLRVREVPGYPDWFMIFFIDITTFLDHDWMTDEYARIGFLERARVFISEITPEDRYSLVYTNVKGFKAVNELFGDQKGDLVIFQTRDILKKHLKPVLMGRLESDHFVLITDDENLKDKNLKAMCSQAFVIESKKFNFEIRCGIYSIKNSRKEITALLAGAKLAEKSIGDDNHNRLYAYYDDTMKENYVKQRFLLSDFERALAEHEFQPYYQPIVDAKTGDIVSAELLIRWKHKDLGMVSPGDFIPVIEAEGKISYLDSFMLDCGLDFVAKRIKEDKNAVPCAINLSRIDFYDADFIGGILKRIKKHNVSPSMIRFEVTESAYADLETKALSHLDKMRKEGIKILLDDYGSGMSSLSMLETFDFDIIKLDLGFIRKIGINDKAEAIIVSTIRLAHAMGAKVTAEGVETDKQLKFLLEADCDYIQGYYFYKPLPKDDFAKVLS
jgi:EAL domain-containing protein (putative c-di-GMP-specific phosphodiesterase class I)/GGDEF domain-containing protein/peptidase E